MSTIDKQRIEAVRTLERLGYRFTGIDWLAPSTTSPAAVPAFDEADAMHALLVLRADKLAGCTGGSDEAAELEMITDTAEAYEQVRWPDGKVPSGKG